MGDFSFQQKCLDRIHQMQNGGVTILFVSHDFKAIEDLCTRALWLEDGKLHGDGPVSEILRQMKERYLWTGANSGDQEKAEKILGLDKIII